MYPTGYEGSRAIRRGGRKAGTRRRVASSRRRADRRRRVATGPARGAEGGTSKLPAPGTCDVGQNTTLEVPA